MAEADLRNFPDNVFCCHILTRLPLVEAVRFSVISRRWCRAWTQLPHLNFSDEFYQSIDNNPNLSAESIINKIILMQRARLESFKLYNCNRFESSIDKWLLWISYSGVTLIALKCMGIQMNISKSIFTCVTLESLYLQNFKMAEMPTSFQRFSQLVECHLHQVDLCEEAFAAILKCQHLESLTVSQCSLPSNYRVVSSTLKTLVLLPGDDNPCLTEANCPRLESIKTHFDLLLHFLTVQSLRKITCCRPINLNIVELLQSFPCLEDLCFMDSSFAPSPKDAAELAIRLPNLRTFAMNMELRRNKKRLISLCSSVLQGSPLLKAVRIGIDCGTETYEPAELACRLKFFNHFLSLSSRFPGAKISVRHRIAPRQ